MLIKVLENRDVILYDDVFGTQNENNVTELIFEFPEAYDDFAKKIVFVTEDENFEKDIIDGSYFLQNTETQFGEFCAYLWATNGNTSEDFRSKMFKIKLNKNENADQEIPPEIQII